MPSRLELRPPRTVQVKDAPERGASKQSQSDSSCAASKARNVFDATTGAHTFVRELAARLRTPRWAVLGVTLFMLLIPAANAASAQAAGPEWKLTVTPSANYFLPDTAEATDENAVYTIEAENVGDQPTSESDPIVLEATVPPSLNPIGVRFYSTALGFLTTSNQNPSGQEPALGESLSEHGYCPTTVRCEYPGPGAGSVPPGQRLIMSVRVDVPAGLSGPLTAQATISGGGAPTAAGATTNEVRAAPLYGISAFTSALTDSSGQAYTQAGGHPYQFSTQIDVATATEAERSGAWGLVGSETVHDPNTLVSELPPGLIANPQAVPHCALAAFFVDECPISTIVGDVGYREGSHYQGTFNQLVPLFNLQPNGAFPGELGYDVQNLPFLITAGVRGGTDYGVTATGSALLSVGLNRVRVNLWGVPADPSHDALRGKICRGTSTYYQGWGFTFGIEPERDCEGDTPANGGSTLGPFPAGGPAEAPPTPFVTLPTQCSGHPLTVVGRSVSYQEPGREVSATTTLPPVDGCNQLSFQPTIEARPTTDLTDSPSGFDFNLKVPQDLDSEGLEDPNGLSTPSLREAVVKLSPGLVVNPSSAGGLGACSPAQIGLTTPVGTSPVQFTDAPAQCPDASKLGTVEVLTQLLHNPLEGSVYLATPHQNPSGGLLAGYIVLEGEGVIIKLAGRFQADPQTGQITASFAENPQTPFKEFRFHFFEGARGALRTPATCGTYEVGSILTPYSAPESGPPAEPVAEFETTAGPTGGACPSVAADEPHNPVFQAGTESPAAGAYSPFSLKLVRRDGEEELKGIETTLPEGLIGRLAGTSYCPDPAIASAAGKTGAAEQAAPSCPASSEVGSVDVASGAGPTPIHVGGKVYLAGPYKGAPLSLAIITPAIAGPFDLGNVVVRTALDVNPFTAQITAKSDPIPTILEGIPLDVRAITLQMSRPKFTLNPTGCEPKQITGAALTVLGVSAPLTQRFQVGGCKALKFKPALKLSLKGGTKRAAYPALKATLTYPSKGDYANIAAAQVGLPRSEFLAQENLDKVCTQPQLKSDACPKSSIYGNAKAWTPLLDKPLEGPVYLGVGFGYKLPALVADLNGQIRVLLAGKTDTDAEGGIRNTFETVPDAPVSKFVLQLKGGPKYGLLRNSENICAKPQRAHARFTAQNGKVVTLVPPIANSCGKKGNGHHKSGKGKKGHKGSKSRLGSALLRGLGGW